MVDNHEAFPVLHGEDVTKAFPVLHADDIVKAFPDLQVGDVVKVSLDAFSTETRFDEMVPGLVSLLEIGPRESAELLLTPVDHDADGGTVDGRAVRVTDRDDQMVLLEVLGPETSGEDA